MEQLEQKPQRAFLVGLDTGAYDAEVSMGELAELCATAGLEVTGHTLQQRGEPSGATYVGSGKLREIADAAAALECALVVFDDELTGAQLRNIERVLDLAVLDRTTVILDIFAGRARSREGAIEVELAQLRYRLPRLIGLHGTLSRLGGGIGTRGPGESQLESDRRHILRRVRALEQKLGEVSATREVQSRARRRRGVPTVALAGYTNVGKSTILNALTGAGVLSEDRLFATLDPTARALALPGGTEAVLIDTVGCISRLPHGRVRAVSATMAHLREADLILLVCDATAREEGRELRVSREVLEELGCAGHPMLTVYNKSDLLESVPAARAGEVFISAKTGEGLEEMLRGIEDALGLRHVERRFLFPYRAGDDLHRLRRGAVIREEEFLADGTAVTAFGERGFLQQFEPYSC